MKIKVITDLPVYLRFYGPKFLVDVYSSFLFSFWLFIFQQYWYLRHFPFSILAAYAYISKSLPMCLVLYISKSVICMSVCTAFSISHNVLLYSIFLGCYALLYSISFSSYTLLYSSTLTVLHCSTAFPLAVYIPTNGVYGFDTTVVALMLLYTLYLWSKYNNILPCLGLISDRHLSTSICFFPAESLVICPEV